VTVLVAGATAAAVRAAARAVPTAGLRLALRRATGPGAAADRAAGEGSPERRELALLGVALVVAAWPAAADRGGVWPAAGVAAGVLVALAGLAGQAPWRRLRPRSRPAPAAAAPPGTRGPAAPPTPPVGAVTVTVQFQVTVARAGRSGRLPAEPG
jgi:hypothetical protein